MKPLLTPSVILVTLCLLIVGSFAKHKSHSQNKNKPVKNHELENKFSEDKQDGKTSDGEVNSEHAPRMAHWSWARMHPASMASKEVSRQTPDKLAGVKCHFQVTNVSKIIKIRIS